MAGRLGVCCVCVCECVVVSLSRPEKLGDRCWLDGLDIKDVRDLA